MKYQYTQEEKQQYFRSLRQQWFESKKLAENDERAKALFLEVQRTTESKQMSYWSFYFTLQDMQANGFEGIPYIDCKTFNGWKQSGFKVMKGEKSKIRGIVWMSTEKDNDDEELFLFPKVYHLFHRSQVEPMGNLN